MAVGTVLALAALGYVLYPLLKEPGERRTGAKLPVCPECGVRPEVDAKFCSDCGSEIGRVPAHNRDG